MGMGVNFFTKKCSQVKIIACYAQDLGKVNLNTADQKLLMSIPGIGLKLAHKIIEYRKEGNGFKSPEELRNIKGITMHKYEKIKDSVIIRQ